MRHRVLVVDDYPDAAQIACMLLDLLGHSCAYATTGTEALARARAFDPDIVILDIGLPDLSGYELARALRSADGGDALYLAAVTGGGEPADRARAFEAGFDDHILKPADLQKLREILARAEARPGAPITRGWR